MMKSVWNFAYVKTIHSSCIVQISGLVPSDEHNGSKGITTGLQLRAHAFFVEFVSGTYVHTQTHPNSIPQLAVDYHSHCHPAIYITHGVINHLLTSHDFQLKFPDTDTVPNIVFPFLYRQWTPYQLRKIVDCACAGNAGNVFLFTDFKENC